MKTILLITMILVSFSSWATELVNLNPELTDGARDAIAMDHFSLDERQEEQAEELDYDETHDVFEEQLAQESHDEGIIY